MPESRTHGHPHGLTLALGLAAALHLGLFALVGHLPPPARPAPLPVSALDLVAVEVTPEPHPEPPPEPPELAARVPPSPREPPERTTERPISRPPSAAPGPVSSALALPATEPAPSEAWTLHVTSDKAGPAASARALAAIGLAGPNPFMGRRETPAEEARAAHDEANRAAGEAIRQAMHDSDVATGLGGGGPVLTALEASVRDGMSADEGKAVLVAVADASGTVLRIDVESSSDDAAFRAVAADLLQRMSGKKVRVPNGAHGLAMRVRVDSKIAPPSGAGPGLDMKNAGGHFDIADLGARPRRVIHARVLAEQVL